ncbi:MAG: HAD family phosphatase [Candidatus Bathyarchaeota archaeon]|nr:MAG: HAD family phosphatase [Candidatus Bathyarchaeota archaeon]
MPIELVIFDIDGTILQAYSWQCIHKSLNTWKQAKKYHTQFYKNQITYEDWARLEAALWKNQPLSKIKRIINQISYTKGVKETFDILRQKGIKIYLLSAGLTQAAERIQEELGTDGYAANTLLAKNGKVTGQVKVNVAFHQKDKHLPTILRKFNLTHYECAAIGDDPTLIPLFKKVALAIAFNPTDKAIERHANAIIRSKDLRSILPYILNKR